MECNAIQQRTLRSKTAFYRNDAEAANTLHDLFQNQNGHLGKTADNYMLKRALKTEEDLTDFYNLSQKDPILRDVVKDLYGMHTVGWPELFPALILAVTLQMAPMKRSNQMMDLLIAKYGEQANFDGKTIRYWPSAQTIASNQPKN